MSDPAEDYVKDLIRDAQLVASYAVRVGLVNGSALFAAVGKVQQLAPGPGRYSSPEVVALQVALNEAVKNVPPETLIALKEGWRPFSKPEYRSRGSIWALVVISIALVIAVAQLSILYNSGTALLKEVTTYSLANPERRLNELSRQLVEARRQIGNNPITAAKDAKGSPPPNDLRWQAYFRIYDDLELLNRQIQGLSSRVYEFRQAAVYPIWGSRMAVYAANSVVGLLPEIKDRTGSPAFPRGTYAPVAEQGIIANIVFYMTRFSRFNPKYTPYEVNNCDLNSDYLLNVDRQLSFITDKMDAKELAHAVNEYLQANYYLKCFELQSGFAAPDVDILKPVLSDILNPYAMWILPGLYGAMGALLFHLRKVADPIIPDPAFSRIVHRVALGALAGMILAWFWTPETRFGNELSNVGFTLFGMAFVFGFSLNIFFAMLERFVAVTEAAVGNIGKTPEKPAKP